MNTNLLVFIGAGLGGLCRFWMASGINKFAGTQFPYGTMLVNISGCFIMGFAFVLILNRLGGLAPQLRSFLLVGFLGGYTTFSSFSIETINLFLNGFKFKAFLYVMLSTCLCLCATWLGLMAAKQI